MRFPSLSVSQMFSAFVMMREPFFASVWKSVKGCRKWAASAACHSRVVRTVADIRAGRYATLRTIFRHSGAGAIDDSHTYREELRSIVLPPRAWAVGRSLAAVRDRGTEVGFTAVRRNGITGREPDASLKLREGDVVVIYGTPEALEHAEAVLLAG